jgi:hypothetical protein
MAASGVWPSDSVKVRVARCPAAIPCSWSLFQDIAESLGISNLSDTVASALAADVEYRLHELIEVSNFCLHYSLYLSHLHRTQESVKFMRHARRTKLKVEDVDLALRVRNIEVVGPPFSRSFCNNTESLPHSRFGGSRPRTLCRIEKRSHRREQYIL